MNLISALKFDSNATKYLLEFYKRLYCNFRIAIEQEQEGGNCYFMHSKIIDSTVLGIISKLGI